MRLIIISSRRRRGKGFVRRCFLRGYKVIRFIYYDPGCSLTIIEINRNELQNKDISTKLLKLRGNFSLSMPPDRDTYAKSTFILS